MTQEARSPADAREVWTGSSAETTSLAEHAAFVAALFAR